MNVFCNVMAMFAAAGMPVSASAQTYQSDDGLRGQERRATVGITIPFGKGGTHSERKPRVELAFDHRRRDANGFELRELTNFKSQRPVRLGLTLSEKPQMMLNGREMPELNDRKNISTGVWIGVGVLAAAGLGLYLLATYQDPDDES